MIPAWRKMSFWTTLNLMSFLQCFSEMFVSSCVCRLNWVFACPCVCVYRLYNESCEEQLPLQRGPVLCCTLDNIPLIRSVIPPLQQDFNPFDCWNCCMLYNSPSCLVPVCDVQFLENLCGKSMMKLTEEPLSTLTVMKIYFKHNRKHIVRTMRPRVLNDVIWQATLVYDFYQSLLYALLRLVLFLTLNSLFISAPFYKRICQCRLCFIWHAV